MYNEDKDKDNNNDNDKENYDDLDNDIDDYKIIKDFQKKLLDLDKNFKTFCFKINIDNIKKEIKDINELLIDINKNKENEIKLLKENISKTYYKFNKYKNIQIK